MAASLKDQLAAAKARISELESELASAEAALTGEAPAPVVDGPEAGTPVWVQAQSGQTWFVEAGSDVYVRLLSEGGVVVEEPEPEAE